MTHSDCDESQANFRLMPSRDFLINGRRLSDLHKIDVQYPMTIMVPTIVRGLPSILEDLGSLEVVLILQIGQATGRKQAKPIKPCSMAFTVLYFNII